MKLSVMAKKVRNLFDSQDLWSVIHKFFTKETVKMATLEFRIAAFMKCTPFDLEDKSVFRVKMFKSKLKLLAWHVANWIYLLQTAFLWISFVWKVCQEPFGQELIMHAIYMALATLGLVFMLSLYMKPRECLVMLNQHGFIVKSAKDSDVDVPHWASHYIVILAVYYFAFCLLGMWLVQAVMFLWEPTSSKHIYAYLPLNWQHNSAVFAAALLHELSWTAWYLSMMGIGFSYWCADIFTMNDILASLSSKVMITKDDAIMYRYLQIFCTLFNDYNGSFFTVGFTTMVVVIPVIFIFVALTATDLNILMFLMLPVVSFFAVFIIMYIFPQYSKVGILSEDCVKVLRSRIIKLRFRIGKGERIQDMMEDIHRRMILKKRMRALPPLGIRIWFFGIYTLDLSQALMEQLFSYVLLLLSL